MLAETGAQPSDHSPIELRVNDLKQYGYCPRIVYYQYVLPVDRVPTYKMTHGAAAQIDLEPLEKRRKLKAYGLERGERLFNVWLRSPRLGLSGRLDLLIHTETDYYPVDFKYTEEPPRHNHLLQLAGYALLVEDHFRIAVTTGFLYLIPKKDVAVLDLSPAVKGEANALLGVIHDMIRRESLPDPTPVRSRCQECEYQNYCADIW